MIILIMMMRIMAMVRIRNLRGCANLREPPEWQFCAIDRVQHHHSVTRPRGAEVFGEWRVMGRRSLDGRVFGSQRRPSAGRTAVGLASCRQCSLLGWYAARLVGCGWLVHGGTLVSWWVGWLYITVASGTWVLVVDSWVKKRLHLLWCGNMLSNVCARNCELMQLVIVSCLLLGDEWDAPISNHWQFEFQVECWFWLRWGCAWLLKEKNTCLLVQSEEFGGNWILFIATTGCCMRYNVTQGSDPSRLLQQQECWVYTQDVSWSHNLEMIQQPFAGRGVTWCCRQFD